MNKKIQLLYTLFIFTIPLFSQSVEPVVATVGGRPITSAEFKLALDKDGVKKTKSEIKEFLNNYIDFKLNVIEGFSEKLDTTDRYKRDFQSSRILLSQPYLRDTTKQIIPYIEGLYNKMQEDVEINQLVFKFDKVRYFPADTLALYTHALQFRKELLAKGFNGVKYADKIEPTSILNDNTENYNGYIGWVSPLMLPPSVANIAYNSPIGTISMPIRSADGYHIIQVLAKRKALGAYKVDMIPFFYPLTPTSAQKDSLKREVESIYKSLKTSYTFDDLSASYLHALNGTAEDCSLGYINYNSPFPHAFISEVFKLKQEGDISSPIETENGYCLVRLAKVSTMKPYSIEMQNDIINAISKSQYLVGYLAFINKEYGKKFDLKIDNKPYQILEGIANTIYPQDTLFLKNVENLDTDLFSIGGKRVYKVRNFVYYMDALSRMFLPDPNSDAPPVLTMEETVRTPLSTDKLSNLFDRYTTSCISLYADSTLEDRIPQFTKEMQAIGEDLLVYEVLDKHVLQPAQKDKYDLEAYFIKNKNKYLWKDKRFKGYILLGNNKEALEKAKELINKSSDSASASQLLKEINSQSGLLSVKDGIWKQGENELIDYKEFGRKELPTLPDGVTEYTVVGRLIKIPESYRDVESEVENDYQAFLRTEWNNKLRNKYAVKINDSVLNTIK